MALLGFVILLTAASGSRRADASAPIAQTPPPSISESKLVNMYFQDRSEAILWQELGYDLPEAVIASDVPGYLAYVPNVPMTPDQYLLARSYNIYVRVLGPVPSSEPDWDPACYRDYNAMLGYLNNLVAQHPNIVELTDIGDTWCKLNPGQCSYNGFDIWRIKLTNRDIPGPKPKFHIVAAHHAREIATPELALQWIHELVTGYGVNADATWLLDNREIYIVPVGNPDGWYRAATTNANKRKNDHTDSQCSLTTWGVDLNRNYDIAWSLPGASSNPCSDTYYGTAPDSEPETQYLIDEYETVLPHSMITIHTYGPYVLYPWGYVPYNQTRPVDVPAYDAIAWNMGRMTNTPRGSVGNDVLYQVSGAVDDWTYDRLGIPSFTVELGGYNGFNAPCSVLPTIVNRYKPMLTYLAKATGTLTQTTFMHGFGPSPTNLSATVTGTTLDVSAVISANYGTTNGAIYSIDIFPEDGIGAPMSLSGQNATASVDVSALPPGRHTVYVQGKAAYNYFGNPDQWGIVSAAFFTTTGALTPTASAVPPTETPVSTSTIPLSSTPVLPTNTLVPTTTSTTIPPTSTPPMCYMYFEDVPPTHVFYPFIHCLYCRESVRGYVDHTFRPNNPVTRGQLAKIVSKSAGFNEPISIQTFEDVPITHTFYVEIERLVARGHMTGYSCGGPGEPCTTGRPYFRPFATATRGQTSKIVANAAGFTETPTGQTFQDAPPSHTFFEFIERLASRNVMQGYPCGGLGEPCTSGRPYFRPGNDVTRGQSAKIVANSFFPGCTR